ncbi:hypothetical protein [Parabacteroides merdae]|uniref:hypothetical protein n=1 Tax=Parabacteroides merdae TaxID=46503 RepID=UPI0034A12D4A
MKRESNVAHHFSFGDRFDEMLMKGYYNSNQCIILSNHQFIGFPFLNKSAGNATGESIAIRKQVGRTSGLPTDKRKPMLLAKRKRRPMSANIIADTAAGF